MHLSLIQGFFVKKEESGKANMRFEQKGDAGHGCHYHRSLGRSLVA